MKNKTITITIKPAQRLIERYEQEAGHKLTEEEFNKIDIERLKNRFK
jgi:hypothetical protein